MSNIKSLFLVGFLLALCSCTVYKKVDLPSQNAIQGYQGDNPEEAKQVAQENAKRLEVYNAEKPFIKNSDNLEWGLAMSGGGVRSATYNFGALKALYDMGWLQKMQIISSVSGGGYQSYALYTNYYNNKNPDSIKPFGYYTFSDDYFLQNVCKQQGLANFVNNWKYVQAIVSPPKGAFNIYKNQIQRSYGNEAPSDLKITDLNQEIKRGEAPYFIINTTLTSTKESDWASSLVEFTPAFYGNPELGFYSYNANNPIYWCEATTISAAALKFKLLHKVPYLGNAITLDYLALSDGGHSENLAAIALIRRGVKNIVIIDAEHNDNYSFDGYKILKTKLQKELNLNLNIKTIDDYLIQREVDSTSILKTAVHYGTISKIPMVTEQQDGLEINIYYIKMSMPQNMLAQRRNLQMIEDGRELNNLFKNTTCKQYKPNGNCKTNHDCSAWQETKSINLNNLALFWIETYATFLNNKKKWKRLGYTFPHTTTADQSFYRDQLAAFIGLGYLQGLELKANINE